MIKFLSKFTINKQICSYSIKLNKGKPKKNIIESNKSYNNRIIDYKTEKNNPIKYKNVLFQKVYPMRKAMIKFIFLFFEFCAIIIISVCVSGTIATILC